MTSSTYSKGGTKLLKGGTKLLKGGTKLLKLLKGGTKLLKGGTKLLKGGTKLLKGGTKLLKGGTKLLKGGTKSLGWATGGGRPTPPTPPPWLRACTCTDRQASYLYKLGLEYETVKPRRNFNLYTLMHAILLQISR